jgi:hypothetical protein
MRLAPSLLLAFAVAGCGTAVTTTQLNTAPRPVTPRSAGCVEIFASGPPQQAYVDVAWLEVDQQDELEGPVYEVMIRRLRERAGELGCDAVVLGAKQEIYPAGFNTNAPLFATSGTRKMQGTCIVYREPRACVPQPGPTPPPRRTCRDRQDFDDHRDCILVI